MIERTDLYRFFDQHGVLLYVGISLSACGRASQHRSEKGWWTQVARMDVEHHPTREIAAQAERAAIKSERPRFNVTHIDTTAEPGMPAKAEPDPGSDPLVGRFFLSPDPQEGWPLQQRQGHVEAHIGGGLYLVQFYEWLNGEPSSQEIKNISQMFDWHFYSNAEDWREHGERGMRARDRHLMRQDARAS